MKNYAKNNILVSKIDFNQQTACRAPTCSSKYTTSDFTVFLPAEL